MLSVVIETRNNEEALARTLACLVPAAVDGTVREVVVCDRGSSDRTAYVAEHAGCVFLSGGDLRQGVERARGDWLLLLEPGARLRDDWMEAVRLHVARESRPARFTTASNSAWFLLPGLFRSGRVLETGLLVSRTVARARLKESGSADTFLRGLRPVRLDAGIEPAPKRPR